LHNNVHQKCAVRFTNRISSVIKWKRRECRMNAIVWRIDPLQR